MRPLFLITMIVSFSLIPENAISQESDTQKRTQEIVASFNKQKHAVKEKHNVRVEKYKRVESEPVIRQSPRDYSGVYEVPGQGFVIDIQVGSDGKVNAVGSEPGNGNTRRFRLEDANITGAMLTGTKVYEDGTKGKFEGVFIRRTSFESPVDKGSSALGLGVVRQLGHVRRHDTRETVLSTQSLGQ